MTVTTWHGWHLCRVENFQEVERLGSICPEPVDEWGEPTTEYAAAGVYHRRKTFWTYIGAKTYLEFRGNRPPVSRGVWEQELRGVPA